MIVFAIVVIVLLLGVVFGSPTIKETADSLFPWSLLVFAITGIAMCVANFRSRNQVNADS